MWDKQTVNQLKQLLDISSNTEEDSMLINKHGLKQSYINNRRYLGNKYTLTSFIRDTVEDNCHGINIVMDIFSGTGAVTDAFKDKNGDNK